MSKAIEFLQSAGTFYVATCEGAQPRVRPFGAVTVHQGRVYFCTNNQKNVFAQLTANPLVEICACQADGAWIRISGTAVVDPSDEARAAMLAANPGLGRMYRLGDGLFEVFYLRDATACIYRFGADPETFAL
ncbi:MAG: hypothetical protein GXY68_04275 [Chloroflexi bacterium]|mgnify:CR=1 FL=1|jgi:uncharacterized pyridoxamine 5'-phosphate oxidase family protein|nr:hypothetical protein [Chloroflexota bacterium]